MGLLVHFNNLTGPRPTFSAMALLYTFYINFELDYLHQMISYSLQYRRERRDAMMHPVIFLMTNFLNIYFTGELIMFKILLELLIRQLDA